MMRMLKILAVRVKSFCAATQNLVETTRTVSQSPPAPGPFFVIFQIFQGVEDLLLLLFLLIAPGPILEKLGTLARY
jgi:hypothetical protein